MLKFEVVLEGDAEAAFLKKVAEHNEFLGADGVSQDGEMKFIIAREIVAMQPNRDWGAIVRSLKVDMPGMGERIQVRKIQYVEEPGCPAGAEKYEAIGTVFQLNGWFAKLLAKYPPQAYGTMSVMSRLPGDKWRMLAWHAASAE
jgi:hypothetical protein